MAAIVFSVAGILFVGGLVVIAAFFGAGLRARTRQRRWLQHHGLRTPGVIVGLERDTDDEESAALFPVVLFAPLGHPVLNARSNSGRYPAAYRVGQPVVVCYDPAQPMRFELHREAPDG